MRRNLRVILCGQRSFGSAVFDALREFPRVELITVYAPIGDKLADNAALRGVTLKVAGTLRSDTMPDADIIVAAHSHDFISRAVRNKLRIGAIGYHPSLLPLHRGRDAVKWTIRMGDKVAGGTVFWLNDTVDGGPVAAQDYCFVRPGDSASSLWRRDLFPLGVRLITETVQNIIDGQLIMRNQDTELATWEPSFSGAPRLYRPEIPLLGNLPEGLKIVK